MTNQKALCLNCALKQTFTDFGPKICYRRHIILLNVNLQKYIDAEKEQPTDIDGDMWIMLT